MPDTDMKSRRMFSNDSAMLEESVKQIRRPEQLHKDRDGIIHELCGPGISIAPKYSMSFTKHMSEVTRQHKAIWRGKRCTGVACPDCLESRIHGWFGSIMKEEYPLDLFKRKQPGQVMHVRFGKTKEIKKDYAHAKVEPKFRTPPRQIRTGDIPTNI